ncbi:bacterioferritin-associated ferredoxin [Simiduia agarivorans]|uniref:Bacterioferritin-associated ferredoxin n=1 Tax=Simiduia agarivorans (strain DSM 21679 / JCM 13881 / BCRC 17597 / SA1) TaxID=1117647 RepID=K4KJW0_SIMAS|nr:bacterioferritin-associated ferredoxin [Simiduia agarivorans]AFU98303.1 bacterioferritin-associated ferredoxin BFD-like-binding region [Simiduia agarivorans SA1 = DSM 21679]
MYVCLCKGITDTQITDAVAGGATNLRQVRKALGVASQCGKCGVLTQEIINETLSMHTSAGTELFYAAV